MGRVSPPCSGQGKGYAPLQSFVNFECKNIKGGELSAFILFYAQNRGNGLDDHDSL